MGLDVSHDAWSGAYSRFHRFRVALAQAAGCGFAPHPLLPEEGLVWRVSPKEPLYPLLNHSDCDGEIEVEDLLPLAARLRELAPHIDPEDFAERAIQFAEGCEAAAAANEPLEFA